MTEPIRVLILVISLLTVFAVQDRFLNQIKINWILNIAFTIIVVAIVYVMIGAVKLIIGL